MRAACKIKEKKNIIKKAFLTEKSGVMVELDKMFILLSNRRKNLRLKKRKSLFLVGIEEVNEIRQTTTRQKRKVSIMWGEGSGGRRSVSCSFEPVETAVLNNNNNSFEQKKIRAFNFGCIREDDEHETGPEQDPKKILLLLFFFLLHLRGQNGSKVNLTVSPSRTTQFFSGWSSTLSRPAGTERERFEPGDTPRW